MGMVIWLQRWTSPLERVPASICHHIVVWDNDNAQQQGTTIMDVTQIIRLAFLLGVGCSLGCASKDFTPLSDTPWYQSGDELSIVYVPPEHQIYVEVPRDGSRFAEFKINNGGELLSSVAGAALGTWAGTAGALAMLGANPH